MLATLAAGVEILKMCTIRDVVIILNLALFAVMVMLYRNMNF